VKKINWKFAAAALALALILSAAAFVIWASDASPASEVALQALASDSLVKVDVQDDWVVFSPVDSSQTKTGFVFYPGGKVDFRAYAPALRKIAAQGYLVAVVPVSLNLAFFDVNAAARVQSAYPEIENWFVGGHSLGGVAASLFAADNAFVKGVVFWASYPADDALKVKDISAVSIYGTNDGLATEEKLNDSRALLPDDAKFVAIEGGNHAQFGAYGFQEGDNEASISAEEQWEQAANATVNFFVEVTR
jgi:dienelactone hydrolase